MILGLATLVSAVDHVTAGWGWLFCSGAPLKFGEECEGFFCSRTCEADLVCFPGAFGSSKCLCPTFTTFEKVCQPNYRWKEVCWEQCVGTPGRKCAENFAPKESKQTDENPNLCLCKSGYVPFPPETPVSCRRESEVTGTISGAGKTTPYPHVKPHVRPFNGEYKKTHSCRWGRHVDLFALALMLGKVLIVLMITTY